MGWKDISRSDVRAFGKIVFYDVQNISDMIKPIDYFEQSEG
jgi:hypothetical protein